ncbi:ribokinase [Arthrobacter castelli]|uniref:ribokinase n=1 Tax=Arthrobacter castelli TaxID=271431 RepID=UPI000416EA5C|nr:ribokinase [Arthrobacter castelli]
MSAGSANERTADVSGRVLVVGSLNMDLTVRTERHPAPGETLAGSELVLAPGGKSANQAAAAGVLGADVVLLGAVGADGHGDMLLDAARQASVDVSAVLRREETSTGTAMIVVDAAGENTIVFSPGANGTLKPEDVRTELFDDAAVLCLCLEIPMDTVLAAARTAAGTGTQVLLNLSPYQSAPDELLALTDVLLVNTHEAAQVLGRESLEGMGAGGPDTSGWEAVLAGFGRLGVPRAVVTLGADGAVVLDATADVGSRIQPIAPTAVDVVDTTGSGDAFTAAIAQQLAEGAALTDAAHVAARAGAMAATRSGAQSSYAALRPPNGT